MKSTGQIIPPELLELYIRICTSINGYTPGTRITRTRRAARRPTGLPKNRPIWLTLERAAGEIATRRGLRIGSDDWMAFTKAETKRLLKGQLDPEWWITLKTVSTTYYRSDPTSILDPHPKPYKYHTDTNRQTIPTYPVGGLSVGPAQADGRTVGTDFKDQYLVWKREVFELETHTYSRLYEPLFMQAACTIDTMGDSRASKPMLSAIGAAAYCKAGDPALTLANPPTVKPFSWWWRYKIPPSNPPYYSAQIERRIFAELASRADYVNLADNDRLVLDVAPRPMFGRGYNNNRFVHQQLVTNTHAYQINPCIAPPGNIRFLNAGTVTVASAINTTPGEFHQTQPGNEPWSVEGVWPYKIARRVFNHVVSTAAASKINIAGGQPPTIPLGTTTSPTLAAIGGNVGADRDLFAFGASSLQMLAQPDYATPTDRDADNIYRTCVTATDSSGISGASQITVTVLHAYNVHRETRTDATASATLFYQNNGYSATELIEGFFNNIIDIANARLLELATLMEETYYDPPGFTHGEITLQPIFPPPWFDRWVIEIFNELGQHVDWFPIASGNYEKFPAPHFVTVTAIPDANNGSRYTFTTYERYTEEKYTIFSPHQIYPLNQTP
jgi:hypothetical protein